MHKVIILFLPVVFSSLAQILLKVASQNVVKSLKWYVVIGSSIAAYVVAFVLYSITVRYYPISVASPVNTIAVMLLVAICGLVIWHEPLDLRQILGIGLGVIALLLMVQGNNSM